MENWETTTLGEVCRRGGGNIQTGPFGSQLHASDYVSVGIPSIMPVNIGENRINIAGIARITTEDANRLEKYRVKKGDIVYSRRGDVERRALIRENENGWLCGTGCLRIRFGEGVTDPLFASYYLGDSEVRKWIVRHAVGATMPNLNTSILSALPFVVPPIEEQRRIAKILSSLDDKIELNRRMNATLEAMAKTLFKAWFVDFEPVRANLENRPSESASPEIAKIFPSEFKETEIGVIPKEWDFQSVYDSARFLNGLAFKQDDFSGENQGMPIIKIVELKNGISTQTQFTEKIFDNNYRVSSEDILFSWSGSPETSIDIFLWIGKDGWLNQHIFKVFPKSNSEREFIYFLLREFKETFISIAKNKQTTGLGHITAKDLKRLQFVLPPQRIIDFFKNESSPIYDLIIVNEKEIQTLSKIRDSLLPRLISGKISVGEIEMESAEKVAN